MKTIKHMLLAAFLLLVLWGCKKDEQPGGMGSMQVRLTDAPGPYDSVKVEIVGMEIHYANGAGWQTMTIIPGVYDLLMLQNGVDTLLVPPQAIPPGKITQMRLNLGTHNYVVAGSTVTPLSIPSGTTSGIKINVNETIPVGTITDILLDFDAGASIVEQGNGELHLKPVIKRL